jgi:hypothetical protein
MQPEEVAEVSYAIQYIWLIESQFLILYNLSFLYLYVKLSTYYNVVLKVTIKL